VRGSLTLASQANRSQQGQSIQFLINLSRKVCGVLYTGVQYPYPVS